VTKPDEPGPKPDVQLDTMSDAVASGALDPFLGVWELDPSRSVYEVGGAPQRATYVLEAVDHEGTRALRVAMAWISAEGQSLSLALVTHVDGIARPITTEAKPAATRTDATRDDAARDDATTDATDAATEDDERPSSIRPPAPVDTLGFDLVDSRTLDSIAYRLGEPRAHVRRTLSEDGRELHVVQTFTMDDRLQLVNESWYVRG
jgi:hypothetical protein